MVRQACLEFIAGFVSGDTRVWGMTPQRYRYRHKSKSDGSIVTDIFTLEDLERGCLDRQGFTPDRWEVLSRDQSTGLVDKNGKEMFECDIAQDTQGRRYPIVFERGAFRTNDVV